MDIDDVLEHRSVMDTSIDDHHSSGLLATGSFGFGHTSIPPSPRSHEIYSTRIPPSPGRYPPEIRLNDGDGSIDTMSFDTVPSPKFISQSDSNLNRLSYFNQSHSRIHDGDDSSLGSQDSRVDDDEAEIYELHSDTGEDTDLFVSPLDRVLNDEDLDPVSKSSNTASSKTYSKML